MTALPRLSQSPTDDAFVQDPYPFYARARMAGELVHWEEYDVTCAVSHSAVNAILRDRRFGREGLRPASVPARLAPFYEIEAHSMLELDPPRHTRLRGLVTRAFSSARVAALEPLIRATAQRLVAELPDGETDLLETFARPLPVLVIAHLIGVPGSDAPQLLAWSNAMVGMYQAGRTRDAEDAAVAASQAFSEYLSHVIAARRANPRDDLLSALIAARDQDDRLSEAELRATVILLLNAGHEATVHTIGNGVAAILQSGHQQAAADPAKVASLVEEVLRYDPPLHLFERVALEDVEVAGHRIHRGTRVACLLASAGRDPAVFPNADRFDPNRAVPPHTAFGAGVHFCVGAPLARLELAIAFETLFNTRAALRLAGSAPRYAPIYHFHGLKELLVAPA
ncbi:MAG: cytochrome P450 [Pseudomonadota bacterium]